MKNYHAPIRYNVFTRINIIIFCIVVNLCTFYDYRETTLTVYVFSLIGMVVYTFTLNIGYIVIVYITAALLG